MGDLFDDDDDGPGSLFVSNHKENPSKEEVLDLPDVFSKPNITKKEEMENKLQDTKEKHIEPLDIKPKTKEKPIEPISPHKEEIKTKTIVPKKPKKIKKTVHLESETKIAVDSLRNELSVQFDALTLIINSIKSNNERTRHLSLPIENLSEHIRSFVIETEAKDQKLKEQDKQINKLSEIFNEKREKEQLRKDITELETEFEAGKSLHDDKSTDELNLEITRLEEELSLLEKQKSTIESNLKKGFHFETEKQANKLEKEIKEIIDTKEIIDASIPHMEQQINNINKENTKLKSEASESTNSDQELQEIRDRLAKKASLIIKELASGALEYIEDGIDTERHYSGSQCITAIKTALSAVADEILNPDTEDEEEEEEEED